MNQEQLAQALGVSRQAVSKWELNEAVPDVNRVIAMSELFGVTTDYLLKSSNANDPKDIHNTEKVVDANDRADQKWLGAVLVIVCALAIFGIWTVVEIKDHYYSWNGVIDYSGDGLIGYFLFNQGMIPVFLALVYGVIGGIRILKGKHFWFPILISKVWRERIDNWYEQSGEVLSDESKAFLATQDDDSDK